MMAFCKTPYLKQVLVPFGEKNTACFLFGGLALCPAEKKTDSHCLLTADKIKTAKCDLHRVNLSVADPLSDKRGRRDPLHIHQ